MFPRNFSLMKQISVFATTACFQRPNRCVQKETRNVYWKSLNFKRQLCQVKGKYGQVCFFLGGSCSFCC